MDQDSPNAQAIADDIVNQGGKIRTLKQQKVDTSVLQPEIDRLLELKNAYKALTGKDFAPPPQQSVKESGSEQKKKKDKVSGEVSNSSSAPAPAKDGPSGGGDIAKKTSKKEEKKMKKQLKDDVDGSKALLPDTPVFVPSKTLLSNLKCELIVSSYDRCLPPTFPAASTLVPTTPAIYTAAGHHSPSLSPQLSSAVFPFPRVIFGANSVARFLPCVCEDSLNSRKAVRGDGSEEAAIVDLLEFEEFILGPLVSKLFGTITEEMLQAFTSKLSGTAAEAFSLLIKPLIGKYPPPAATTDVSEAVTELASALDRLESSSRYIAVILPPMSPSSSSTQESSYSPTNTASLVLGPVIAVALCLTDSTAAPSATFPTVNSTPSSVSMDSGNPLSFFACCIPGSSPASDSTATATQTPLNSAPTRPLLLTFASQILLLPYFKTALSKAVTSTDIALGLKPVATSTVIELTGPAPAVEHNWSDPDLVASLRLLFGAAIRHGFPDAPETEVLIARCGNAAHGDFQCNDAMGLAKIVKSMPGYNGPKSPVGIAERIIAAIPANPIIASANAAPNGFINIILAPSVLVAAVTSVIQNGIAAPPMDKKRVLVDFSSPNIAKEMHVGHLRSTIIGDAICRVLEFCGHEVLRVNHVGDWGTQFGMLISYLQEKYPDIATSSPNISDLTAIYKLSKKRFDEDEKFKELSRQNVVKLQAGDASCRHIWKQLCDISRAEFQKVYDILKVDLVEVGESFYNPLIPGVIEELRSVGLVTDEEGMQIIKLPHFTIPLILQKSDGGYGYDSTDMAALSHRLRTLNREWVIVITDAGQAPHFHMCFDAARAAGWVKAGSSSTEPQRLDHIGFGVVCGDDGKRFKTRASETVRLIDLLNAASDRMRESLQGRVDEGKSALQGEELIRAAKIIGYGAVKYFDLKQNPITNYIFSYDRMLDTKGDTAVYLLFAYARLASILRKAKDDKGVSVEILSSSAATVIQVQHPAERALAFKLLQFGDVLKLVLRDLMPNRLCEYLKELCEDATDFVTKCQVLNSEEIHSRVLLCEATRRAMAKCFELLGIESLERI